MILSDQLFKLFLLECERIHRFAGFIQQLLEISIVFDLFLFGEQVQTHFAVVVERFKLLLNQRFHFVDSSICFLFHLVMNKVHGLKVT